MGEWLAKRRRAIRDRLAPSPGVLKSSRTRDEIAALLRTSDVGVADALLHEAERLAGEPFERAESAERRAATLQGAIAIAASFSLAASALLIDKTKIGSQHWRVLFAAASLGFVGCLVAAGFRSVGAVYRTYRWHYVKTDEVFSRRGGSAADAKTAYAASLLESVEPNQAIARIKVAYMRAAAWWFRLSLVFLVTNGVLLVIYALTT